MTATIIITFSVLLLFAYLFDITASKTKVPAVILLLLLGWIVKQLVIFFEIQLPNFSSILPVFGTIGLVLIVLEGSLELQLNRSKIGLIKKSFFGALMPMFVLAFSLAFLFHHFERSTFKLGLLNAIPLCIISSAIAIPSVRNLRPAEKEFVIYESSLSDILGVLFFNFIALHEKIGVFSFVHFGFQIVIIVVVSFFATIGLSILLNKIEHHIKFIPIILLITLIYATSKLYHLPGLLFVLLFGLFINNVDELSHLKWMRKLKPGELDKEVHRLKVITIEATFLVRALFFLLFGFMIDTSEILNTDTLLWALIIVAFIVVLRVIQLKISELPLKPLMFIAPRGLITILLFLSLESTQNISLVSKPLITQVIILTAFLMMIGLMTTDQGVNGPKGKNK
jgi:Kef-type K+ transport system membrane component KefB